MHYRFYILPAFLLAACAPNLAQPSRTPVASGEVVHVTKKGFTLKGAEDFTFVTMTNAKALGKLKAGQGVTIYGKATPTGKGNEQEVELQEIVLNTGESITLRN